MAMTLEELKKGMSDKVFDYIVDIFLRESAIMSELSFDDCVSASGGGSTLKYKYLRKVLPAVAEFRKINAEYTGSVATKQEYEAALTILGGKVEFDRVLNKAAGKFDNMAYQIEEHIKAMINLFHYTMINGDAVSTASTDHPEFEGLDSMLAGTTTEYNADGLINLSTIADMKSENADLFYEMLTRLVNATSADALIMNNDMISKVQTIARLLGYRTETEEAFGRKVTSLDGVKFIDLKNYYTVESGAASATPIVPIVTREIDGTDTEGLTDIYAVKFDVNDGFHGISLAGSAVIEQYLPNFNEPGVMHGAEVEMVTATVLKNTQHAGVLRNVKIR